MRFCKRKILAVALVALSALAVSGGVAFAVFPADNVTHFTGCLNTSASPGGTFVNVAQGESPSKACGKGQVLAHLSGGDITNVQTASGSGLAGGTDNGAASLALDSTGCSGGGVLKWNGTSWACGSDQNSGGTITGVQAGAGLAGGGTSGSVSLSMAGGYQLPQNCGSGQVPKSDGTNSWSCADDNNSETAAYTAHGGTVEIHRGFDTTVTTLNIANNPGYYTITAVQTIGAGSVSGGGNAECDLYVNGNLVYVSGADADLDYAIGSASESDAEQLGPSAKIEAECQKDPETSALLDVLESRITAVKVGALSSQAGGP